MEDTFPPVCHRKLAINGASVALPPLPVVDCP